MYQSQAGWNSPVTSTRAVRSRACSTTTRTTRRSRSRTICRIRSPTRISGTGFSWGNYGNTYGHNASHNFNTRFAASYVTGSHAIKAGVTFMHLWALTSSDVVNNGMTLQLLNGVPRQVTVFATPFAFEEILKANWGCFAQDQWTLKRMTINAGVRFDALERLRAGADARARARRCRTGTSRSTRSTACRSGGTSRRGSACPTTCSGPARPRVKFSIGKYLEAPNPPTYTRPANPAGGLVQSATRTWADRNGDFVPQPNELGPLSQANFGNSVITTRYADEVLTTRSYNWESGGAGSARDRAAGSPSTPAISGGGTATCESTDNLLADAGRLRHLLRHGAARCAAAGRRWLRCLRAGQRVTGGFGQTQQPDLDWRRTSATPKEIFNGVDFTTNARLPRGIVVSGGPSIGRVATNNCFVVDSPQDAVELRHQAAVPAQREAARRLSAAVGRDPDQRRRSRAWPGRRSPPAARIPTPRFCRRSGATCRPARTARRRVPLIAPGHAVRGAALSARLPRVEDLPARVARRLQANVDLYNAVNSSSILGAQQHLRRDLAAADERAAGAAAQVRGAVRFLTGAVAGRPAKCTRARLTRSQDRFRF